VSKLAAFAGKVGLRSSNKRAEMEDELREILLNILRDGILRIRSFGWSGHADLCAVEADHIHNLPALIRDLNPELLAGYFDIARPCFIREGKRTETFDADWARLGSILAKMRPDAK
jgi:hypothetical protein